MGARCSATRKLARATVAGSHRARIAQYPARFGVLPGKPRAGRRESPRRVSPADERDLGMHGLLPELLELTEPYFIPEVHGLQVGNNLIKANMELGHLHRAR